MKSIIKKILFRGVYPKPFLGVRIDEGGIKERVFLKNGIHELDVSERHNIVCETPFCVAVWISEPHLILFTADRWKLKISKAGKTIASMSIKMIHRLEQDKGAVLIFQIVKARCYQLGLFHQFILIAFFFSGKRHSYSETEIYGALYSYPRKVIVTSFREKEYYNIFPMDFQGEYPESRIYLFGLKATNITVNKIIEKKRVVVSDTGAIDTGTIYVLGAHHSNSPPKIGDLSFKVMESELFGFPVPDFSSSYKEVEIINSRRLGSHFLLVGKVLNAKTENEKHCSLYHVHFFEYLQSGYKEV
jgi:flavin reductase (DIM6/NTAB) family NADH-FMN oxidoreductase RutF